MICHTDANFNFWCLKQLWYVGACVFMYTCHTSICSVYTIKTFHLYSFGNLYKQTEQQHTANTMLDCHKSMNYQQESSSSFHAQVLCPYPCAQQKVSGKAKHLYIHVIYTTSYEILLLINCNQNICKSFLCKIRGHKFRVFKATL